MNPKDYDFVAKIKSYIKDGDKADEFLKNIDVDGFKKDLDENYVNPIASNRENRIRDKAKEEVLPDVQKEVQSNIIKELGVDAENTDGLKAWAKRLQSSTEEKDEAYTRLEKELKEKNETLEQLQGKASEADKYKTILQMDDYGVRKEAREDAYNLASQRVSEDKPLDSVLEEMKSNDLYASFFEKADAGSGVNPDDNDEPLSPEKEQEEWEKKWGV